jgi:hypothetical protein
VHYDTAANLELRGILTREAHPELAHLLPAEPQEAPRRAPAPHPRKRDPLPDTEHHTVIDLVGASLVLSCFFSDTCSQMDDDNVIITIAKRPKRVVQVNEL